MGFCRVAHIYQKIIRCGSQTDGTVHGYLAFSVTKLANRKRHLISIGVSRRARVMSMERAFTLKCFRLGNIYILYFILPSKTSFDERWLAFSLTNNIHDVSIYATLPKHQELG